MFVVVEFWYTHTTPSLVRNAKRKLKILLCFFNIWKRFVGDFPYAVSAKRSDSQGIGYMSERHAKPVTIMSRLTQNRDSKGDRGGLVVAGIMV